eukprot:COSAG02_NODE_1732_length_11170_cov_15.656942_2_plen_311_part_00
MLEQAEREMDRKVVALAQTKARELQECMARAESYEEGRELQIQYKADMAHASAILTADRHAQRRKLEARLQGRKSRYRQNMLGTAGPDADARPRTSTTKTTTSTRSMALVAMLSKHQQQVRDYLEQHHRDDLLPVYEHTLRPCDDHDQAPGMIRQGGGPDGPLPPPPPPVADMPPAKYHDAHAHANDEQENAPPPDADNATSRPEAQVRPRGRPRLSSHGRTRATPNGWATRAEQIAAGGDKVAGHVVSVMVKVGDGQPPPPPANVLSLESYLGLAAARRSLSSSVSSRKVKVTPKMREEWAKQGKLLEF